MAIGFWSKLSSLGKKIASGASSVLQKGAEIAQKALPMVQQVGGLMSNSDNKKVQQAGRNISQGLQFINPYVERLLGGV